MIGALMEPGLFTIERETVTGKDPLGKPIVTWADAATDVDGRLEQLQSAEGDTFIVGKYRAFMPKDTDLRADDRVVARGQVYTVEGTPSVEDIPGFASALANVAAVLKWVGPVVSP